jgi:hypothetical protein
LDLVATVPNVGNEASIDLSDVAVGAARAAITFLAIIPRMSVAECMEHIAAAED